MSTRTRKDWILWGALGCALVSTAHAEYTLATAAHFNKYVALAVPGALDLYVVRALQQRRDVFVAVLAMVAANVASHLIAGRVLEVHWPVIAAVGAVAPLIVWRVYSLKYTRTRQELLFDLPAGAMSAPVLEEAGAPECTCTWWRRVLAWFGRGECTCTSPQVSPHSETSAPHSWSGVPDTECTRRYTSAEAHEELTCTECGGDRWLHKPPSAPAGTPSAPGVGRTWPDDYKVSAPVLAWVPGYHLDGCDGMHPGEDPRLCEDQASAPASTDPVPYLYDSGSGRPTKWYPMAPASTAYPEEVQVHLPAPDLVPDWMAEEYPVSARPSCSISEPFLRPLDSKCSECGDRWGDHPGVQRKRAEHLLKYPDYEDTSAPTSARHLNALPDLPPEYLPSAVHSESPLTERDLPFVPSAQRYVDDVADPSIRGLMRAINVGQDRAGRLLTHLGVLL